MTYRETIQEILSLRPRGLLFLLFVFVPVAAGVLVQQGLAAIIIRQLGISTSILAVVLGMMIGVIWMILVVLYYFLFVRIRDSVMGKKHRHGRE